MLKGYTRFLFAFDIAFLVAEFSILYLVPWTHLYAFTHYIHKVHTL